MNVTSLGYRTDLMIRRMEGSEVTDCRDHIVVRSPAHPAYWWGNFLLLAAAPKPRETAKWLARFAEVFPAAGHVALGIDTTQPHAADGSGLFEAGLRIERSTVMTASDLREPPHQDLLAEYRPLEGEKDWQRSLELRLAADDAGKFAVTRAFYEQRTFDARRLAENGHGAWFGAFEDGQLVAQLGVFSDGSGIARYQNVETHPAWRRHGAGRDAGLARGPLGPRSAGRPDARHRRGPGRRSDPRLPVGRFRRHGEPDRLPARSLHRHVSSGLTAQRGRSRRSLCCRPPRSFRRGRA